MRMSMAVMGVVIAVIDIRIRTVMMMIGGRTIAIVAMMMVMMPTRICIGCIVAIGMIVEMVVAVVIRVMAMMKMAMIVQVDGGSINMCIGFGISAGIFLIQCIAKRLILFPLRTFCHHHWG